MIHLTHSGSFNQTLANRFKALGHPTRLAIVQYLLKVNHAHCGEIVKVMPVSQSTVSQHLKELKTAGILQSREEGTAVDYFIKTDTLRDLNRYLSLLCP
ncbi:MAG TPA: metalloregulator ArsR/SmtB family transcription factor [Luteibaculaceae bacterium]|nr:metalloregulator ArsR/SmtB family transcription factor [Luteibaculaceae bacterium]